MIPSPTARLLTAPTRTPSACTLPLDWTTYIVQSGNTLYSIAQATGSSVEELRYANCIEDADFITAGRTIFVPASPNRPIVTPVPIRASGALRVNGCDFPQAQITSPILGQRLSGDFTVFGTASANDFGFYTIEVRPDDSDVYNLYSESFAPRQNTELGTVDAEFFNDGLHWLRLTVVDSRSNIRVGAVCEIPVIFD